MTHVATQKYEGRRITCSTCKAAHVTNCMPWAVQKEERAVAEVVESFETAYSQGMRASEIDFS